MLQPGDIEELRKQADQEGGLLFWREDSQDHVLHEEMRRRFVDLIDAFSDGATSGALELQMRTSEALDAERYRYLRNAAGQWAGDECGPMVCSGCSDNFEYLRGEEVDDEVDEAMAEWKAAGCPLPKEAK